MSEVGRETDDLMPLSDTTSLSVSKAILGAKREHSDNSSGEASDHTTKRVMRRHVGVSRRPTLT